jgi:putative FmdB family regulatory protein
MPIYEYICPKHGKFEALRGVEEKSTPCPSCGNKSKRVPSFSIKKKFTRIDQADGEGLTVRYTSHDEIKEQRRGWFLGQT